MYIEMEALPKYFESAIILAWLKGLTRDEIAQEFGISEGTVSNILAKMRKSLGNYEFDSIREHVRHLRQQDMTAADCASGFRTHRILEKLKIPEKEVEQFLTTIFEFSQKMGINSDIIHDSLNEIARLSSDEMHISEIPNYLQSQTDEIKQLKNEKRDLQEQINGLKNEKLSEEKELKNSYQSAKITSSNLETFVNTRDKLEGYGIPVDDIDKFARFIQGIRNYSNYDPFKVIEKFSDLKTSEIEIESNQKIKSNLEIDIQQLEETKSDYDDRLNIKNIKLKNLDELERIGFSIQDLKKLKGILMEISSEHKNLNIEQIKILFFELLERYETRIALESENNTLLQLKIILQHQIKNKRQTLHCQEVVGPILKDLFDYGLEESDIIAIKALIDILLYNMGKDMTKLNEKKEIISDLSSYSNLKLAKINLRQDINNILNTENLADIQEHINKLNKSSSINNSEKSNDRKYLVLCDSIF